MSPYVKFIYLLAGILLVSCNSMKQEPEEFTGTLPVKAAEEVDLKAWFSSYETACLVIDSMEEFKEVAPEGVTLPVIDFDRYSLVIGQAALAHAGFKFERQSIDIQTDKVILTVRYKEMPGSHATAIKCFYFWGLYDKIPDLPFKLKVEKK